MRPSFRDRRKARRAMRAMRRVLEARGFACRPSTANDWQETWTRGERVSVVLSRLDGAGNAEAEVCARQGGASIVLLTYSPTELGGFIARAYGARAR